MFLQSVSCLPAGNIAVMLNGFDVSVGHILLEGISRIFGNILFVEVLVNFLGEIGYQVNLAVAGHRQGGGNHGLNFRGGLDHYLAVGVDDAGMSLATAEGFFLGRKLLGLFKR